MVIIILTGAFAYFLITDHKSNQNKDKKKEEWDSNSTELTMEGASINRGSGEPTKAFTEAQLKAANTALASGVEINDPQNDWVKVPKGTKQPDGRYDNDQPYPLGWTDYRSLSIGADQNYIYFKYRFWGEFPKKTSLN